MTYLCIYVCKYISLVGWSVDLSVGWSVGRLVNWLVSQSVHWSVGPSIGWSVGWLVGWSVGRSVGWSVGRSVGWLVCRSVSRSVQIPDDKQEILITTKAFQYFLKIYEQNLSRTLFRQSSFRLVAILKSINKILEK